MYDEWKEHIDFKSKHHRLKRRASEWTNKQLIGSAFEKVFRQFQKSIIVVSYRSDGIPSIEELVALLQKYKRNVRVEQYGQYRYVLSVNEETQEMLLIGSKENVIRKHHLPRLSRINFTKLQRPSLLRNLESSRRV